MKKSGAYDFSHWHWSLENRWAFTHNKDKTTSARFYYICGYLMELHFKSIYDLLFMNNQYIPVKFYIILAKGRAVYE